MISAGNEAGDILSEINGGPDLDDVQQLIRNSSQMNEDLVRVYTMLDAGHLDGAYQKIQQAVQNRPEDVSVKKALAAIYSGQEQHEKAANILMEVLQSNADDSEARISLMHVLAALRNYEGVLVVTDWLLADDPYATEIHHAAALASLELDETPQAIIHLKRIIEIDAQNRVARNLLGVAYRRQGAYEKAIKLFTEQLAMDDVDSSVYYNLAVCYAQRHQAQKSVEYLSKAVDLFGASFVKAWLQSDNFDAVRNDSSFMALNNSLAGKTSSAP